MTTIQTPKGKRIRGTRLELILGYAQRIIDTIPTVANQYGYAKISDVRTAVAGPRPIIQEAFELLAQCDGVYIFPQSAQWTLNDKDRTDGLVVGREMKHNIEIKGDVVMR